MKARYLAAFGLVFAGAAQAEPPSTSEDWQHFYNSCVEGSGPILRQRNVDPAQVCGCIRDSIQKLSPAQMDAQFAAIQNACVRSASSRRPASDWPAEGIENSLRNCRSYVPADIPATKVESYCSCAVQLTVKSIPWKEYLLLDAANRAKGPNNLDQAERAILAKWLEVRHYCSLKEK
jgi:hypothetical protein